MKIHEYQAKALLPKFGVKIPRGIVGRSVEEAIEAGKLAGSRRKGVWGAIRGECQPDSGE